MIKEIITKNATVTGDRVKLIDVENGSDLVNLGEVRIFDENAELVGLYAEDEEIEVRVGFEQSDGSTVSDTIFTGYIQEFDGEELIVLKLKGKGDDLRKRTYKKSFNGTDSRTVVSRILKDSGVKYELGTVPVIKRHSYICANGTHFEELIRAIDSFDLDIVPYFDRDGVLIVKPRDEAAVQTEIIFEDETFDRFDKNTLTAFLDIEIEVFNIIKILELDYYVYNNRFYVDDYKTKSILTVGKV